MKITGVKIEKLLLELTSPFRVAFGTITHSENVMIKVTTDEGVTGYGEAAPLAFVTAETTDSVIAALELFRTGLIGMDPLDIEAVHAMMDGLMGGNSSAKCAVDLAMYDIRGKAAGNQDKQRDVPRPPPGRGKQGLRISADGGGAGRRKGWTLRKGRGRFCHGRKVG